MGTRGLIGFRLNGKDKTTYNHFDSYPDGIGKDILKEIKEIKDFEKLKETVKNIVLVNNDTKPTKEQIKECKQFSDTTISEQTLKDWYCLLRDTQGTLKPYINQEVKYMIDSIDFIYDSLFCEWAYIVNLDSMKLEVFEGFQKYPNKNNRYGTKLNNKYYPCKLFKEYDLNKLPTEKQFIKDLAREE